MKIRFICITLAMILAACTAYSQGTQQAVAQAPDSTTVTQSIYEEVVPFGIEGFEADTAVYDTMAKFPYGISGVRKFVENNTRYPMIAMENGIQGTVIISFRVNPDGVVDDVKVLRSVDPSLDREALRVMALFPKWKPAQRNGKSVSSYYVQPFRFYLQQ